MKKLILIFIFLLALSVPVSCNNCSHESLSHTEEKQSTCEQEGNREHWYCVECEAFISRLGAASKCEVFINLLRAASKCEAFISRLGAASKCEVFINLLRAASRYEVFISRLGAARKCEAFISRLGAGRKCEVFISRLGAEPRAFNADKIITYLLSSEKNGFALNCAKKTPRNKKYVEKSERNLCIFTMQKLTSESHL